ncbi:MAG: exodeoxyribonuclease VII small subunit [Clostridia bacterium]|jgi:exodeoxyribonuclease VII small subunit|nr:exodeoxyribonuclease VII small subunit [Clostridia bacterium]MDD4502704.1 exodeoxyribonuclease VII small subunit [Clostridia bacterium]NLV33437.1 exodeoxyribonuclease VII small subunit [Clostridiaceae bacterium]HPB16398.1 exodeoxyribonuclease VII small subunit [Clostridia bacterium]HQO69914.1 exodeoxyribonuclease VII small subunit [Clostridia bacterium]
MNNKDFNELYKELEKKVELLEKGELSLEQAVKTYTEGQELIKLLNEKLDKAREKMVVTDKIEQKELE